MQLKTKLLIGLPVIAVVLVLLYFFVKNTIVCYLIGLCFGISFYSFLSWGFTYKFSIEKTTTTGTAEDSVTKKTLIEGSK